MLTAAHKEPAMSTTAKATVSVPIAQLEPGDTVGGLTVESCELHGDRVRVVCWAPRDGRVDVREVTA